MEIKLTNFHFLSITMDFRKRLLLMIMRTFIFLLCTTVFSFNVETSFSQERVVIDIDKLVTVDELFEIIMNQTEYSFLYPENIFKNHPKVQLKKGKFSVSKLLSDTMSIANYNIVLTENNTILIKDSNSRQQIVVTGRVTDESGMPIVGATVLIKGTTKGTATDFDGAYSISVSNPENVLVFSALGYATQEITVGNQSSYNVALVEQISKLGEVIINAGYYSIKDRERTGNISRITAKEIETQPVSNVLAAMHGRMSGVNVIQTTGVPGGGFDLKIRGTNSLRANANAPLYIIDGIPFNTQPMGYVQTSQAILSGVMSPLSLIDPNSILSIEVLKDADATAIYGSRGSNGVVLITTKKGKSGSTQIQLNSYTGVSRYTRPMSLLNTQQFQEMRLQAFENDGITDYPLNAYDLNGTWDPNRSTDWQKELLGNTADLHQISLSVSGGNANTQYLLSTLWRKENTVFSGSSDYSKTTTSLSGSHQSPNTRLKLEFGAFFNLERSNLPGQDLTSQAMILPPNAPELYDDEGNLNWEGGTFNNPLAFLNGSYNAKNNSLLTQANIRYQLQPNWSASVNMGYNEYHIDESKTAPHTLYNPSFGLTSAASNLIINSGKRTSWLLEPQLNGKIALGSLKVSALVGGTLQYEQTSQTSMIGVGFANNYLIHNIQAANIISIPKQIDNEYRYAAIYGRLNFDLKDTYLLNITGRRDGSSRFGPDNRYANFGALGLAWILTNESILKDIPLLSFAKLRASYGTNGSDQIGDYQYLDTYQTTPNNYAGILGLQPTRLANPNFGWESNRKLEAALETSWFLDRLFLNLSYYKNRSSNQLVGIPLPATTGFGSIQANLNAEVENRGVELEMSVIPIRTEAFTWNLSGNISWQRNTLLSFDGLESSTYANTFVIGESINILKLYNNLGVNPETGVYNFVDSDGNGTISGFGDRTFIANLDPQYFGGLQNQLRYKNWELDMNWQFVKQQGRNYRFRQLAPGALENIPDYYIGSTWTSEVGGTPPHQMLTTGANPAASLGHALQSLSNSSISDASFVRLKNVQLAYTFNQIDKLRIKMYVQGQNLLIFTKYKGLDPETRSSTILPPLTQLVMGAQIQF